MKGTCKCVVNSSDFQKPMKNQKTGNNKIRGEKNNQQQKKEEKGGNTEAIKMYHTIKKIIKKNKITLTSKYKKEINYKMRIIKKTTLK